jgi:hypothetical protein
MVAEFTLPAKPSLEERTRQWLISYMLAGKEPLILIARVQRLDVRSSQRSIGPILQITLAIDPPREIPATAWMVTFKGFETVLIAPEELPIGQRFHKLQKALGEVDLPWGEGINGVELLEIMSAWIGRVVTVSMSLSDYANHVYLRPNIQGALIGGSDG